MRYNKGGWIVSDFAQKVNELSRRSRHASQHALTEEATKTSVVLPLIQAFGFDPFNLEEVVPEYVADVGLKKGEKIDFALNINGVLSVLIEVKPITMPLGTAQYSQLFRLCCTNRVRDSSRESNVVAAGHEQTHAPRLQDPELA